MSDKPSKELRERLQGWKKFPDSPIWAGSFGSTVWLLLDALDAEEKKRLDCEYETSCGHKWTVRHTACPVCFIELRAEVERLTQQNADDLAQHVAEVTRIRARSDAEVERLREALEEIVACDGQNTRETAEVAIARAALEAK